MIGFLVQEGIGDDSRNVLSTVKLDYLLTTQSSSSDCYRHPIPFRVYEICAVYLALFGRHTHSLMNWRDRYRGFNHHRSNE